MITWHNKKLCDAGFYINLDKRIDRKEKCENELLKSGISGVERFPAVLLEEGEFREFGCTESHIQIARKQIENNWEYVLYMEDDIETVYYYSDEFKMENIDKEGVSSAIIDELNIHKPDILWLGVRLEGECESYSTTFMKPTKTLMAHAYLGSLKFAKFLIEYLDYRSTNYFARKWPIDFFISQMGVKNDWTIFSLESKNFVDNDLKILVASPLIFTQGQSYSDISYKYNDYSLWVNQSFYAYGDYKKHNIKALIKNT